MAKKMNIKNEFPKVIVNIAALKNNKAKNSKIALQKNYEVLIENFNYAQKMTTKSETCIQKIFEFCTAAKSKLQFHTVTAMNFINYAHKYENEEIELIIYFEYIQQSIEFIESLSGDMRINALEQRVEVLNNMRASMEPNGSFFKNFYYIIFKRNENQVVWELLDCALNVHFTTMLFMIEQYGHLAEHYYKNRNLHQFKQYLRNAFLMFKQMQGQIAGKNNFIDKIVLLDPWSVTPFSTWKAVLRTLNFPAVDECIQNCYEFESSIHEMTTLHVAAYRADVEVIKTVLETKPGDLNVADQAGFTPLHCAVLADGAAAEYLSAYKNTDLNAQSKAGLTPLHIAVINNSTDAVKILLSNKQIDVNVATIDGWTALHMAVALRNAEIVDEILKVENVAVNAKIFGQINALHIAARLDEANLMKKLLEKGAADDTLSEAGLSARKIAQKFGCQNALKVFGRCEEKAAKTSKESTIITSTTLAAQPTTSTSAPLLQQRAVESTVTISTNNSSEEETANAPALNTYNSGETAVEAPKGTGTAAATTLLKLLYQAVLKCDLKSIKTLIAGGADVTRVHKSGKNILDFAVISGNVEILAYFLDEHNLIAPETNRSIESLLFHAAQSGLFDIVKYLIEVKGVNPQGLVVEGVSLLCAAIAGGNFEIVKYLIEDQCLSTESTEENCPAYAATKIGSFEMIRYLFSKGSKKDGVYDPRCDAEGMWRKKYYMNVPILYAAQNSSLELFKQILELGASIDTKSITGGVLNHAVLGGNLEVLRFLIEEKNYELKTVLDGGTYLFFRAARTANLEFFIYLLEEIEFSFIQFGRTILHEAAFNRNLDVIKFFVEEYGLDEKARDDKNFMPVHYAAKDNNVEAVKYFVKDRQLGVNLKVGMNRTLLHIAAMNGQLDVARYLVDEEKANLNVKDADGLTPLFMVAKWGTNAELFDFLLKSGADQIVINVIGIGESILHFAAEYGYVEILKVLIDKHGMDPDSKDTKNKTPLFYAVSSNEAHEATDFLINSKNVDIHHKDNNGETAIFFALRAYNVKAFELLVQRDARVLLQKNKKDELPEFRGGVFRPLENFCDEQLKLIKED